MKKLLSRAWAEIHLDRLKNNLDELKRINDNSQTEIMCVVKADAYGHGDKHIAPFLESQGIKYFAVSNIIEAQTLRKCGIKSDILILGHTPPDYAGELAKYDIIQAIVGEEYAAKLSEEAKKCGCIVRTHAAVDTGMGRIGVSADDAQACANALARMYRLEGIALEGMFTHFAVADSTDDHNIAYTESQKSKFFSAYDCLREMGITFKHRHCLNSAGGVLHYDSRSTLVRYGILLYGLMPDNSLDLPVSLMPVMDLKAAVSYVKTLDKGDFVGYGRTYCADRKITAATIPIGYADGYARALSNNGYVLINGCKAPIIGRVCMDQIVVDTSGIPDVCEGTVVTLIGKDGNEAITADMLAQLYGTIGYEVVCGISKRVPRIYYGADGVIIPE